MTYNIPQASLVPSQKYWVKVRSLVVAGDSSDYGGIQSEWSIAVTWTSHAGTLLPPQICHAQICQRTADITIFLVYCVYAVVNHIISSVPRSPPPPTGSQLVPQHLDLCLHQHVCGHGLLRNLLDGDVLSEVGSLSVSHVEVLAVDNDFI